MMNTEEMFIILYIITSAHPKWFISPPWICYNLNFLFHFIFVQTNTFQAALATDGVFSFILFNYRIAEMTWDYENLASKDVIIGYNALNKFLENAHLENPPFNTSAMRFTPDQYNGTTGLQVEYTYWDIAYGYQVLQYKILVFWKIWGWYVLLIIYICFLLAPLWDTDSFSLRGWFMWS